jgi:uncharacterized protein
MNIRFKAASCGLSALLMMAASSHLSAAKKTQSLAFKNAASNQRIFTLPPDAGSRLWDVFMLTQKASSGNAFAQHELGLRYLLGETVTADTFKAAYWIGKAAEQNLVSANYNYGILLSNGWGVDWNPFEAYKRFQYAAERGMKEARYVFGLLQTDNLTVERNDREAYRWIKMSADSDYTPAKETLADFIRHGITDSVKTQSGSDTVRHPSSPDPPARAPVVTGFQSADADMSPDSTSEAPEDNVLLKEVLLEYRSRDGDPEAPPDSGMTLEETVAATMPSIRSAADAGSPEALTLMGRMYETGLILKQNDLSASIFYLRAVRNNSPWAPALLWKLTRKGNYFVHLTGRVSERDPVAKFVWAELNAFGFDGQLSGEQVVAFLEEAAERQFHEANLELGLMCYSGKWVDRDREKGKWLLKQAAEAGNREARVRLWMIELNDGASVNRSFLVDSLRQASGDGSVLAQSMLGFCCQKGIGLPRSVPSALFYYRRAAQRGSKSAYNALKEMYAEIRPKDPEFQVSE